MTTLLPAGHRFLLVMPLLALVLSLLLGACGGEPPSAEELVQARCTQCHTLAPIEVSTKTHQEWNLTVSRMIQRGARLNDREAKAVVDYLSNTYGADNP